MLFPLFPPKVKYLAYKYITKYVQDLMWGKLQNSDERDKRTK